MKFKVFLLLSLLSCRMVAQANFHFAPASPTQDTNYTTYEAPWLAAHGGYVAITIPWSQYDTGTTAPNYTWGADANILTYLTNANSGGSCVTNCVPIALTFKVSSSPGSNDNTFTPVYPFSTTYQASVSAPQPGQACMCTNYPSLGTWTNACHYVGDGGGFTAAQIAAGLPVMWQNGTNVNPLMVAWKAFTAAAIAHYKALLGTQFYYLRFGKLGPNEEQHDYCAAQQYGLPGGGGNITAFESVWLTALTSYIQAEQAANTSNLELQTAVNQEQTGNGNWLPDEAAIVVANGEDLAFQGVLSADAGCFAAGTFTPGTCTDWIDTFRKYSSTNIEMQTTFPSCTNGNSGCGANANIEGSLTVIVPFFMQQCGLGRKCFYEAFPTDADCVLATGFTFTTGASGGCFSTGQFYSYYQNSMAPTNFVNGAPIYTSSFKGKAAGTT